MQSASGVFVDRLGKKYVSRSSLHLCECLENGLVHMPVRKYSGNPQGEWQIHLPSQLNPYLDRQSSFLSASRRAWCRSTSLPMLSPPNARAPGPSIFCQAPGDLGCGNPVLGAFGSSTTGHAWSYAVRFIAGSRSGVATRYKVS